MPLCQGSRERKRNTMIRKTGLNSPLSVLHVFCTPGAALERGPGISLSLAFWGLQIPAPSRGGAQTPDPRASGHGMVADSNLGLRHRPWSIKTGRCVDHEKDGAVQDVKDGVRGRPHCAQIRPHGLGARPRDGPLVLKKGQVGASA
eukprot:3935811-Prymnesium_polylepis.1